MKCCRFQITGSIGTEWLDHPPLNLLCEEMKNEFLAVLDKMAADDRVGAALLGGGCELTLPCDLVVAQQGISIGLPEASRGIFPGTGRGR